VLDRAAGIEPLAFDAPSMGKQKAFLTDNGICGAAWWPLTPSEPKKGITAFVFGSVNSNHRIEYQHVIGYLLQQLIRIIMFGLQ
jgi:hypothetical protein